MLIGLWHICLPLIRFATLRWLRLKPKLMATLEADAGQTWIPGIRTLLIVDAGTVEDAGAPDAGPPDAGGSPDEDGGTLGPGPDLHVGCGCSGAGASWVPLLALALLGASRALARRH